MDDPFRPALKLLFSKKKRVNETQPKKKRKEKRSSIFLPDRSRRCNSIKLASKAQVAGRIVPLEVFWKVGEEEEEPRSLRL